MFLGSFQPSAHSNSQREAARLPLCSAETLGSHFSASSHALINAVNAEPRKVRMNFKPTNASIIGTRLDSDKNMSVHGTIQHEVYEGDNAMNFQQGDSIKITVERKRDGHNEPVDFMLMMTLEVAEGSGLPIYNEVKASLEVGVPIMA